MAHPYHNQKQASGDLAQGYHFARAMDEATVTGNLGGYDIYLKVDLPPVIDCQGFSNREHSVGKRSGFARLSN
jgi:hypothetical protein